jgi:hypothetical protein
MCFLKRILNRNNLQLVIARELAGKQAGNDRSNLIAVLKKYNLLVSILVLTFCSQKVKKTFSVL